MSASIPPKVELIEPKGAEWAKERTLADLVSQVRISNRILTRIGGDNAKDLEHLTTLDNQAGKAAQGLQQTTAKLRITEQAVEDLETSLYKSRRRYDQMSERMEAWGRNLSSSQGAARSFGGFLETTGNKLGQSLSTLPVAGPALGAAMAGITIATSMAITRIIEARDTFGEMVQGGLLFNGNIMQFAADVRETGLTLGQFSQIAQRFNTSLVLMGEQRYLRSINNLTTTFGQLGLNAQQGAEFLAEYVDQSRLTSSAYFRTQEQQEAAFKENIIQQTALARLTGLSVREQQAERRRTAERTSMRLMAAQLGQEQRVVFDQLLGPLSNILGTEGATGMLLQVFGKGATRAGGAAAQTVGPEFMAELQQAVASGNAQSFVGNLPQLMGGVLQMAQRLPAMAGEAGGPAAQLAEQVVRALAPAQMAQDPARAQQFRDLLAGTTTALDASSQAVMNTTREFEKAIGALDGAFTRMAGSILESLTPALNEASRRLSAVTPEQIQSIMNFITNPSQLLTAAGLTVAGGAALGAGTLYAGRRLLRAGTTPATSRLARIGRLVPGLGGVAAGGAEYLNSGDWFKSLFVGAGALGGGILGGAGGTALLPGVGTVAGGVAGGMAGENIARGIYEWFAGAPAALSPGATPGEAPAATFAATNFQQDLIDTLEDGFRLMGQKIDLLNTKLADTSLIATTLTEIKSQISNTASNTHDTQRILNDRL
jgi:hypothetical protein